MEARRGTIFGAYLKLLPVFLFLIPGMIAFALHQNISVPVVKVSYRCWLTEQQMLMPPSRH